MNRKIFSASVLAAVLLAAVSSAQTAPRYAGGANLGSAQLYASVMGDGTLVEARSKGALPCEYSGKCLVPLLTGVYEVSFARNIENCVYVASAVESAQHNVGVALNGADTVRVVVLDINTQALAPWHFNLIVLC